MNSNARISSLILSECCDFLESKGVSIDSEERLQAVARSNFKVSAIYGSDYQELYNRIEKLIASFN